MVCRTIMCAVSPWMVKWPGSAEADFWRWLTSLRARSKRSASSGPSLASGAWRWRETKSGSAPAQRCIECRRTRGKTSNIDMQAAPYFIVTTAILLTTFTLSAQQKAIEPTAQSQDHAEPMIEDLKLTRALSLE